MKKAATGLLLLAAFPPNVIGGKAALHEYWSRPARALNSGEAPGFSPYPADCAACHRDKWTEWDGSLHSRSVGPGLTVQLDPYTEPGFAVSCYRCHAPLLEQNEVAAGDEARYRTNALFDDVLKKSGISCAVCHLRKGVIHGPIPPSGKPALSAPHPSSPEPFFAEAEFCAACHQLEGGYDLNGKALTNTFMEWKGSVYGERNITCQSCHMPGKRHLFRGIHDPDMVRSGVRIEAERNDKSGEVSGTLKITNAAVGHFFPTYVTPAVVIKGFLAGPDGDILKGSLKEGVVGRKVTLDLSAEEFDTRIPPLKTFRFDYDPGAGVVINKMVALVFEVWVYPDEFYRRFFSALLNRDNPAEVDIELAEALRATERSGFLLFQRKFPLDH